MGKDLAVAIIHYHLKPGGVTRVIENAYHALKHRPIDIAVITGEPYKGNVLPNTKTVPALGYGEQKTAKDLVKEIKKAAHAALGKHPDLWHIHNHSLGKNTALTQAVSILAKDTPILLQIHDFAEDGRPKNYQTLSPCKDLLYPQAEHIHYATLNSRDYHFLINAGIVQKQLHLLANPVSFAKLPSDQKKFFIDKRLTLYPTRSIRRKNIGEFLLWAILSNDDQHFAATLAPTNPEALPVYKNWVSFAKQHHIRVSFDIVNKNPGSFHPLINEADQLITTSVAEGFGLAFLEPFLANKPLVGRNLPNITEDFTEHSIDLSNLYKRLNIPYDLVAKSSLEKILEAQLKKTYAAYDTPFTAEVYSKAFNSIRQENMLDFGRLHETHQEKVLLKIIKDPTLKKIIKPRQLTQAKEKIQQNKQLIKKNYSIENYGDLLLNKYSKISNITPHAMFYLDPRKILKEFLNPNNFNLLRT